MTTWADIAVGDRVELRGRAWTVDKLKRKGKRVHVTVSNGGNTASTELRAKDAVERVDDAAPKAKTKRTAEPAERWATDAEARAAGVPPLPPTTGPTAPPLEPSTDVWGSPRTKAEARVMRGLEAVLVAEGDDRGYYVPPVTPGTVASHLAIFHIEPDARPILNMVREGAPDYAGMVVEHDIVHAAAERGDVRLALNHWHTATRPPAQ